MAASDADAIERITAALVRAIAEAKAMMEMDAAATLCAWWYGTLVICMDYCRNRWWSPNPLAERLRGMSDAFALNLDRLKQVLTNDVPRRSS